MRSAYPLARSEPRRSKLKLLLPVIRTCWTRSHTTSLCVAIRSAPIEHGVVAHVVAHIVAYGSARVLRKCPFACLYADPWDWILLTDAEPELDTHVHTCLYGNTHVLTHMSIHVYTHAYAAHANACLRTWLYAYLCTDFRDRDPTRAHAQSEQALQPRPCPPWINSAKKGGSIFFSGQARRTRLLVPSRPLVVCAVPSRPCDHNGQAMRYLGGAVSPDRVR